MAIKIKPDSAADRPAFPCSVFMGMTLMEYYVAHAPKEIPEWFKHSMDHDPKPAGPVSPPYIYFSQIKRYTHEWDCDNDDWYEGIETTENHNVDKKNILEYYEKFSSYTEAMREWNRRNDIERYFQWRVFYGKSVIEFL